MELGDKSEQYPYFFLGDSAGGTDYKMGLSGGRGLLAVDFVVEALSQGVPFAKNAYQMYWQEVIDKEFNRDPTLVLNPRIQF